MPIEQLDVIPSRYRPTTYTEDMEAFLAWLQRNVPNYNALEQSLQLVATTGTSSSTLTVGTGVRNLAAPAGKAWAVGSWVVLAYAGGVSNLMLGQITAYNSTSGAMTVDVKSATGTGTYSSWVISLGAARGGSETFSGTVSAQRLEAGDALFAALLAAGVPTLQFDEGDALRYNRSTDTLEILIDGIVKFAVKASGPERPGDADTPNGLVRKQQAESIAGVAASSAASAVEGKVPGLGQAWQNVTASRASGVTYYNTTSRPIFVSVSAATAAGDSSAAIVVNGQTVMNQVVRGPYAQGAAACAMVPPGASYSANVTATLASWNELR